LLVCFFCSITVDRICVAIVVIHSHASVLLPEKKINKE
jgi:hypothetical protein